MHRSGVRLGCRRLRKREGMCRRRNVVGGAIWAVEEEEVVDLPHFSAWD